jgi:hypothetical protein
MVMNRGSTLSRLIERFVGVWACPARGRWALWPRVRVALASSLPNDCRAIVLATKIEGIRKIRDSLAKHCIDDVVDGLSSFGGLNGSFGGGYLVV